MPDVWTWNRNELKGLIRSLIRDTNAHLHLDLKIPSEGTLEKLSIWAKASARWELGDTAPDAVKPGVAGNIVKLYAGMDALAKGFNTNGIPVPNDETLAKLTSMIGLRILNGESETGATSAVLQDYGAHPANYTVSDGGRPFAMTDPARVDLP